MKKRVVVLGASGSIGTQTIDILLQHVNDFEIVGLSVGKKISFLIDYLDKFNLDYACVENYSDYLSLVKKYPKTKFFYGNKGLEEIVSVKNIDIVCNGLQGIIGLLPTIKAIENHCDVAIANKETLVAGGDIVNEYIDKYNVNLIPVDSEHSAIFQTINGYDKKDINKLIITASGGAFRNLSRDELKHVNIKQALNHPQWKMGAKITIDSATMMNKGFEVIEAHQLFRMPYDKIDVILHPQSIVHSMTEFVDHSVLAQLAVADMRLPIQYALTYPHRIINSSAELSLAEVGNLTFTTMDYDRFPLLDLAYAVGYMGGNMPAILNGANEVAVNLFLNEKISFLDIEKIIFATVKRGKNEFIIKPSLDDILYSNNWAQKTAEKIVEEDLL